MRKRRRIVFVNRYFFPDESATSQLLSDLSFHLAGRGLEVHIVCSRQLYGNPRAALKPQEAVRGVLVHRLWTTRFGRSRLVGRACDYLSFYCSCMVALVVMLRGTDIVIAKTDPPLISIVAALAARLKGAALINWLQDVYPEVASELGANPLPAVLDRLLRTWRDASLRAAQINVVLGSRMQDYVVSRGLPRRGTEVIANWAHAGAEAPKGVDASALRERLGLTHKFVVAYSGNLGRAHEYQVFFAAATLLRGDSGVQFLFIGGGAQMTTLQALAEKSALPNMRFLPYQPRESLRDSLAAADVHLVSLLPSLEGLIVPSKFYGILAVGRPVVFVGDPDGELARVIRAAGCGLVVRSGSAADLVQAIHDLRSDAARRGAMGAAAWALSTTRFDTASAMGRWMQVLSGLEARP